MPFNHNSFKVFELHNHVVTKILAQSNCIFNFNLEHDFIWEFIYSNEFFKDKICHKFSAKEFNSVKFLNSCQNLSFFSEPEAIIIFGAEDLTKEQIEDINSSFLYTSDKNIFLISSNKKNNIEKFFNADQFNKITIENYKFWEVNSYVNFLINYFKIEIELNSSIKQFIITNFENDLVTLYLTIKDLSNLVSHNKVSMEEIEQYFSSSYKSIFDLATSLSLKKFNQVFGQIRKVYEDQKFEIYLILNFLLKHIIKLSDAKSLKNKTKLSKYEKEIIKFSASWSQKEIERMISVFSELVLLCKIKDTFIGPKLQSYELLSKN